MILDRIDELLKEVSNLSAQNAEEIEQLRLKYLSKKGEINELMADFRNVAADQKKTIGIKINELKQLAISRINELKEKCETQETVSDDIDLTRTAYPIQLGTRHPCRTRSLSRPIPMKWQRMSYSAHTRPMTRAIIWRHTSRLSV